MNKARQRYPFPMHPAELYPFFLGMCTVLSDSEVKILAEKVAERKSDIKGEGHEQQLSVRLAGASAHLVTLYPSMGARERKLIVGAVRSYLMHRDSIPDHTPGIWFKDDIAVMNYVMEQVGVEGHFISAELSKGSF